MTEVRFYHLTTQSLEQALPVILAKGLASGRKAIVRFGTEDDVKSFNDHLWTYHPDSFLPHGSSTDAFPECQPIYLTARDENPNTADMLVLCRLTDAPDFMSDFGLCCDFLDGRDDDAIDAGRARWKKYKELGFAVTYWQQSETGSWEQKA